MSPFDSSKSPLPLDYQAIFNTLPLPCLIFKADDPDFTIVDMNAARTRQTGTAYAETIGRPLFSVFPSRGNRLNDRGDELLSVIREVIKTGEVRQVQTLRPLVKGGKRPPGNWQRTYIPLKSPVGRVTHILAVTRDITEELGRARRTSEMEERLKLALSVGKIGSWMWDMEKDAAVLDSTAAKLLGAESHREGTTVSRATFLRAVSAEDRSRLETALRTAIARHVSLDEEVRLRAPSGKTRWVLVRGKLETREGRLMFPGVIVDITERRDLLAQVELAHRQDQLNRQAARILQERNAELEAISRSKDEFVALASHQLRTPATAVKQYLGMVLQGYVGNISGEQSEVLGKAFESNERQIQIINQILNAARVDTGRLVLTPAPVEMGSLLHGITTDMQSMLEAHHHRLQLEVPRHLLRVKADMEYLRMAIENVVHNAVIYTPDGGTITLGLSRHGRRCWITVTDTGVGIRKSDLNKLFIKFSRIHNPLSVEAGGSGIGLYLAAEIVRLHDGTIRVRSALGKGTTFVISLPLVHNES